MNKPKLYTLILLYWLLSFSFISYFGIIMISAFIEIVGLDLDQMENPVAAYWVSPIQMVEAGLFGIFFGLLFIAVNEVSEKTKIEQLSFGKVILFKSLLYLLGPFEGIVNERNFENVHEFFSSVKFEFLTKILGNFIEIFVVAIRNDDIFNIVSKRCQSFFF